MFHCGVHRPTPQVPTDIAPPPVVVDLVDAAPAPPAAQVALVDVEGSGAKSPTEHDLAKLDVRKVIDDIEKEVATVGAVTAKNEGAESESRYNPKDRVLVEQLKAALEAQEFPARSPLGQRFKRELTDEEQKVYAGLLTDKARKEFREGWAQRKLKSLEVSNVHSKEWRRVDEQMGEYKTVEALAVDFGFAVNPEGSLEAARKHAIRCAKMGGKWLYYDERAELHLFLHLKVQFRESMTEMWGMYERFHQNQEAAPAPQASVAIDWFCVKLACRSLNWATKVKLATTAIILDWVC